MKIRSGFVSNSSSASFIVEIKMDNESKGKRKTEWEDLLATLYDNVFPKEKCLEIVEKRLKFFKEYRKPVEDATALEIKKYEYQIKNLEEDLESIEKSDKDSFSDLVENYKVARASEAWCQKLTDEDITKYSLSILRDNKAKAVRCTMNALRWTLTMTDDNYFCINIDGPSCYNGWEDIIMRNELVELVAFLQFMRFDFKTRVISHEGAF